MDSKKRFGIKRKPIAPSPRVVGMARNDFGTRLCQRVQCEKCGKTDYVPVRVASSKSQFCRDCAERVLAAYDQGRQIAEKKINCTCEQCHRPFQVSESVANKKSELLCIDCLRGFDVWRGSTLSKKTTTNRSRLVRMGSRTTFRKNDDEL